MIIFNGKFLYLIDIINKIDTKLINKILLNNKIFLQILE